MTGILRSVENRVPMARATNTGLSAIIDSRGVIAPAEQIPPGRPGVLRGKMVLRPGGSFYTRAGYLLPGWVLTPLLLAVWVRASWRARKLRAAVMETEEKKRGARRTRQPRPRRRR